MEQELIEAISNIKLKPLLVDPKAEMKAQNQGAKAETLVDYDRIGQLAV